MTLLVAGTDHRSVWIAADTAITSETRPVRERSQTLKVYPLGASSLVGFAGNADRALQSVRHAAGLPPGREVLAALLESHNVRHDVDFAYTFLVNGVPKLFKVANGEAIETTSFYLGQHDAFERLQRARHSPKIDHAPNASHIFICYLPERRSSADLPLAQLPEGLTETIKAMHAIFPQTSGREVGGTPIPYILSRYGAQPVPYAYAVSDPIIPALTAGDLIPHGTAEGGGYGFSLTELRERDGVVLYWRQRPGGEVVVRDSGVDTVHSFEGVPREFVEAVKVKLGRDIDVFSEGPPSNEPVYSVQDLVTESGERPITVVSRGRTISFSWNGSQVTFRAQARNVVVGPSETVTSTTEDGLSVRLDPEAGTLVLDPSISRDALPVSLSAAEIDLQMRRLAELRPQLSDPVPRDPKPGEQFLAENDPRWELRRIAHHDARGFALYLRHSGYGWQSYFLPEAEAQEIARIMSMNTAAKSSPDDV